MADGRHLGKTAISRQRFQQFRPNLARQRTPSLLKALTIKNLEFLQIQNGGDRHLGKSKNRHILVPLISTKFGMATHFDPLKPPTVENLEF